MPEGRRAIGHCVGEEAEKAGADVVETMAQLGVDKVVDELDVEDLAADGAVKFSKKVFKVFEVEAEFASRGVGKKGAEGGGVEVGHFSCPNGFS